MTGDIATTNKTQIVFDESRCYYQIRLKNGGQFASERCTAKRVIDKGIYSIYCQEHRQVVREAHMGAAHELAWGSFV